MILAVGGKNGLGGTCTTGESVDSTSLDLMGQQETLMREVYASNHNMVIVHTDGRPLCSEWAYEHVPAIIEAWLPATYGAQAIADVISGAYNPAGRTPISVPRTAGHLPLYTEGCRHLNLAANVCGYTPVSLGKLIKDGILAGIDSIHRETIDRAAKRKSDRDAWLKEY